MIRKSLSLLLLFAGAVLFISIGQSCRPHYYDLYVKNVNLYGTDYYNPADSATFTDTVVFAVRPEGKNECCYQGNPFISSCYAHAVIKRWKNEIVPSSFKLSFNRGFSIGGDTVLPNTNILALPAFAQHSFVKIDNDAEAPYVMGISDSLRSKMKLDSLPYIVTFSCTAGSGSNFSDNMTAVFK
jgi:hypothetical protein